jgi:hypothetical protein
LSFGFSLGLVRIFSFSLGFALLSLLAKPLADPLLVALAGTFALAAPFTLCKSRRTAKQKQQHYEN